MLLTAWAYARESQKWRMLGPRRLQEVTTKGELEDMHISNSSRKSMLIPISSLHLLIPKIKHLMDSTFKWYNNFSILIRSLQKQYHIRRINRKCFIWTSKAWRKTVTTTIKRIKAVVPNLRFASGKRISARNLLRILQNLRSDYSSIRMTLNQRVGNLTKIIFNWCSRCTQIKANSITRWETRWT